MGILIMMKPNPVDGITHSLCLLVLVVGVAKTLSTPPNYDNLGMREPSTQSSTSILFHKKPLYYDVESFDTNQ
jgi:hypothetical protein